jgi:hypothetical protein
MQPQQPKQPFDDIRTGFNFVSWLISGYATAILPFLRKDFGADFFGLNALVAAVVMILFGAMEHSDDLLPYLFIWIVFVAAHRLDAYRNHRKGRIIHSRYVGDNWFASKLPPTKHKTVQMVIEPVVCLLVGALICPYSPGIGKFLIVGAFAVMLFNGTQRAVMQRRVRRMHDAHIEQQTTARMFRGQDEDF